MNLTVSDAPSVAALRINMMPPKLRLHRDVIFTLEDLFGAKKLPLYAYFKFSNFNDCVVLPV